jgi:ParB family chromosome partitioning protein
VRRDLSVFEEADGLAALRERFEYTHADLSGKLGRSRPAVTELLAIATIQEPVRELCYKKAVLGKTQLVQVARAGDRAKMEATVLRIAEGGLSRDDVARARREEDGEPKRGRPKHFAFRWQAPEKSFAVQIRFRKTRVSKAEVLAAVRSLLEQLEGSD